MVLFFMLSKAFNIQRAALTIAKPSLSSLSYMMVENINNFDEIGGNIPEKNSPLYRPLRCLDYFCRNGDSTLELLRQYPEAKIVGYDPDVLHITVAQNRFVNHYQLKFTDRLSITPRYDIIQIKHFPSEKHRFDHSVISKLLRKKQGILCIHKSSFPHVLDQYEGFALHFEPIYEFKDMLYFASI